VKKLIIFSLFALAACSDRTAIPKDIIPPDSMQKIMFDVIMAEEYSSLYVSKDSLKHDKVKANQDLLEDVFKIHHISRENFKKSLHFYESRPDLNKKIFDSLAAFVNQRRQDFYRPKSLPKPVVTPKK
jgi:hypothetical protein